MPPRWLDYRLEALLERSDEAGIDRSCLMALHDPFSDSANRQLADFCAKAPNKMIGFAVHNPQREAGRVRARPIEEVPLMGLKGVRSDGHPTRELLDTMAELKVPVMFYPDPKEYGGPGWGHYMIATAYPSVNFILPHLGAGRTGQWWAHYEAIDLVRRFPNVYVETSSVVSRKCLDMVARDVPAEKILFGTFALVLDPRIEIYSVKLLKLPKPSKAFILGGNMQRLLGLR